MKRLITMFVVLLASCASQPGKVSGTDRYPNEAKPIVRANPQYPRVAVDKHVEGCVVAAFDVDDEGLADHFVILDSQPPGMFDQATLNALVQWRWEKGKPGRQTQAIDYKLSSSGDHPLAQPCIGQEEAHARMAGTSKQ